MSNKVQGISEPCFLPQVASLTWPFSVCCRLLTFPTLLCSPGNYMGNCCDRIPPGFGTPVAGRRGGLHAEGQGMHSKLNERERNLHLVHGCYTVWFELECSTSWMHAFIQDLITLPSWMSNNVSFGASDIPTSRVTEGGHCQPCLCHSVIMVVDK
jgi:hypothetical protein